MSSDLPTISTAEILAARPPKNAVDVTRPYAFLVERERAASGRVDDVATLFLTNRECPFRCLMCDLWKNTTDDRVPVGAIPAQIDFALSQMSLSLSSAAKHIKLYNSGNFFDRNAIPREDHAAIIERVRHFDTVIVENHPRFCGEVCVRFRDALNTELEVAIGLETAHPEILARLNKQMTLDDFSQATEFLTRHGIHVRTFLLLRPPFLDEEQGIEWALRSVEFAFDAGVRCCAVIPTRAGNGLMEQLESDGHFAPPSLFALESVLQTALDRHPAGRVFVDLWDIEKSFDCAQCGPRRAARLVEMNHSQTVTPLIECACRAPNREH